MTQLRKNHFQETRLSVMDTLTVGAEKIRPRTDDPENYEKQKGVKSTSTDLTIFRNSQGLYTYISHLFISQHFQDRQ